MGKKSDSLMDREAQGSQAWSSGLDECEAHCPDAAFVGHGDSILWTGILWDHVEQALLHFLLCPLFPAAACQQQMCLAGLCLVASKHSNIDFSMPGCLTNGVLRRHRVFCVLMWKHIEQWITAVSRSWSGHTCWLCGWQVCAKGRCRQDCWGACRGQAGQTVQGSLTKSHQAGLSLQLTNVWSNDGFTQPQ